MEIYVVTSMIPTIPRYDAFYTVRVTLDDFGLIPFGAITVKENEFFHLRASFQISTRGSVFGMDSR